MTAKEKTMNNPKDPQAFSGLCDECHEETDVGVVKNSECEQVQMCSSCQATYEEAAK